jgi:hypothetical protein
MKKLLTILFAVALGPASWGQSECGELLDSNQDGYIGVEDLMNLLSYFGDSDLDFDGVFDSVDNCIGAFDECGVCNGPGAQVQSIDSILAFTDSTYNEVLNGWEYYLNQDTVFTLVCVNPGCTYPEAENYDPYASENDGSCENANQEYEVTNIPVFEYPIEFGSGEQILTSGDDVYSDSIPVGFEFLFFGIPVSNFRVSSNGWMSFDLAEAAGYNPQGVIPNSSLPKNSIMAAYSDLDLSNCGYVETSIIGDAPNRRRIIAWYACQFSCTSNPPVEAMIVLQESNNSIQILIGNRQACSWGNVCTGVQNFDGTVGSFPEGFETGNWVAIEVGWYFSYPD